MGEHIRCNQSAHSDRFLVRRDPVPWHAGRDGVAVHARRLLAEPLKEVGRIGRLAARVCERLAILPRYQSCDVLLVGDHQVIPTAQHLGALAARPGLEGLEGCRRSCDGELGVGAVHIGGGADDFAVCWVCGDWLAGVSSHWGDRGSMYHRRRRSCLTSPSPTRR